MKKFIYLTLLLPSLSFAFSPITDEEKTKLLKDEMITYVEWKKELIWPVVSIRVPLKGSPEENLKVFMEFDKHKDYVPDVVKSKVTKTIDENHLEVFFEMDMPWPVNKSTYTNLYTLTSPQPGSKKIEWKLIDGNVLKDTYGFLHFIPYEGKTLLEYQTTIVPKSSLAKMFKSRVQSDVELAVQKIVNYLNKRTAK